MKIFDPPVQTDGVWKTSRLWQLRKEISEAPTSWLGAIGSILLITLVGRVHGRQHAMLGDAGLSLAERESLATFMQQFPTYELPPGYALDDAPGGPLVEVKTTELGDNQTVINIHALHVLALGCCEQVAGVDLPPHLTLKAV